MTINTLHEVKLGKQRKDTEAQYESGIQNTSHLNRNAKLHKKQNSDNTRKIKCSKLR